MYFIVDAMQDQRKGLEDIAQECMALETMSRLGCFHGLGFTYLEQISRSPPSIGMICGFGNEDDQHTCIEGTVEKLSDLDEATALKVCEHLEGRNRSVCLGAAKGKMYRLDKDFALYIEGS